MVLHLFSFISTMVNGWICDCVWLSCTQQSQHLTRRSCWNMVIWNGNCGNSMGAGSLSGFTKILNDCRERLQPTLNKSSVLSYALACREHTQCVEHSTVLVATRQVAIEGFLKMRGTDKVRLGTLRRRLQHDSIIGDINWIHIEVGRVFTILPYIRRNSKASGDSCMLSGPSGPWEICSKSQ